MKKKVLKICFVIIILLLTIWLIMFFTDYARSRKKLNPIYIVKNENINNKHYYYGIFYKIEHEYAIGGSGKPITKIISVKMYLFDKQIMYK